MCRVRKAQIKRKGGEIWRGIGEMLKCEQSQAILVGMKTQAGFAAEDSREMKTAS
jgi:hypothetical protein